MPRITLTSIHDKLESIQDDIAVLKAGKEDKNINRLNLKALELKVEDVRKDVDNINSYGKWLVILIVGTLITAVLTALITGRFK